MTGSLHPGIIAIPGAMDLQAALAGEFAFIDKSIKIPAVSRLRGHHLMISQSRSGRTTFLRLLM